MNSNILLNYFSIFALFLLVCILIYCIFFCKDNFQVKMEKIDLNKINEMNKDSDLSPPNYTNEKEEINQTNETQDKQNNCNNCNHNKIQRIKTGRDAYQQENFVNIYDSNFGGLLGTTLGLK